MGKLLKLRTVYRFVGGRKGRASKIDFKSLRVGDYFFTEEPNGDIAIGNRGHVIFRVKSKIDVSRPGDMPKFIVQADEIA